MGRLGSGVRVSASLRGSVRIVAPRRGSVGSGVRGSASFQLNCIFVLADQNPQTAEERIEGVNRPPFCQEILFWPPIVYA